MPVRQILFALFVPFVSFGLGTWIYFLTAAIRRGDRRQYPVAVAYAVLVIVGFTMAFVVDPSPIESDNYTTAENIGFPIFLLVPLIAAVHGAILATRYGHRDEEDWLTRETARQFATFEPLRARQLGIGRPEMPRGIADGGLVDLNHATGSELAGLPGVPYFVAQRIVADRAQHGPFRRVEDLMLRGLLPAKTIRRITPSVICIPADQITSAPIAGTHP
jgi:hypothetical protein